MDHIVWDARFNIQVEAIDDQHRQLVDLVNRLIDIQGQETSDDDIIDILGSLTNYLGDHFETEEQLMIDHGYPDLEPHREEHQAFVTQTAYFIATFRESGTSLKRDLLLFLKKWLVDHIVKTDAAFGAFLKDTSAG